jgi:acetyl esterase/lipase
MARAASKVEASVFVRQWLFDRVHLPEAICERSEAGLNQTGVAMPASWQANAASFLLRHLFKPRLVRAQDAIAARKAMTSPSLPVPRGVRIQETRVGGVAGEWVTADAAPRRATLLYLHGGGYFACSPRTHRAATTAFALEGLRTFAPDYRLAPEHPFPAALDDALSVYRDLIEQHDPRELVVAGDSAGGGLSVALLLRLRDEGLPLPAAAALFSPFVDLAATGASARRNSARCAMFTHEVFPRAARFYLGERDPRMPLASPLYADPRGLPPLLIHVGEDETLLDDSRRLAERARAAGVAVTMREWPRVPHVWQLFHRFVPEGRVSLHEAAEFMASRATRP